MENGHSNSSSIQIIMVGNFLQLYMEDFSFTHGKRLHNYGKSQFFIGKLTILEGFFWCHSWHRARNETRCAEPKAFPAKRATPGTVDGCQILHHREDG